MSNRASELKEIKRSLSEIDKKVDELIKLHSTQRTTRESVPNTLGSLPRHLQETARTIATLGEGTAENVADKTGRTRAAESDYLNQLASRGFLRKERKGRKTHFQVFKLYTICPQCDASVLISLDQCPMCGALLSNNR